MKAHLPWKRETFDPTSWVSHLASLLPNGEVRGYGVRQTQVRILSAPLPGCANFNLSIFICSVQFSSVFSRSVVSNSLWPHGLQHARPPCPSPTPVVYPSSWPLSRWCHPTTSSSIIPFSSLPSIFSRIRVFSNALHEVAKVLEFQLQQWSFQWTPRIDLL